MFERIRNLFATAGVAEPTAAEAAGVDELHLAAAALLAEAALSDTHFDHGELRAVERLVRERFGLTADEAERLIEAAERQAKDASHLLRFTKAIKENFSQPERVELIEMIWEVVYADGELHAYEDTLLRRIAGLIYVSDRDRGAARRRVRERLRAEGRDISA